MKTRVSFKFWCKEKENMSAPPSTFINSCQISFLEPKLQAQTKALAFGYETPKNPQKKKRIQTPEISQKKKRNKKKKIE